jgi:hypothetical protein
MTKSVTQENIWKYISHIQKLISINNKDFDRQNKKLEEKLESIKLYIDRKKESVLNLEEIRLICITEWKNAINCAIDIMLETISKRKTKGSEFSDIKLQLNKIKEDIKIEEFDIDKYDNIYETDLKGFREQIREKIDNEKYNNRRFWIGIAIGFILGIVTSIIIWGLQTWMK